MIVIVRRIGSREEGFQVKLIINWRRPFNTPPRAKLRLTRTALIQAEGLEQQRIADTKKHGDATPEELAGVLALLRRMENGGYDSARHSLPARTASPWLRRSRRQLFIGALLAACPGYRLIAWWYGRRR